MATKSSIPIREDPREKRRQAMLIAAEKEKFMKPLIHMKNGKLLIQNKKK
jgi:hypothetical protein